MDSAAFGEARRFLAEDYGFMDLAGMAGGSVGGMNGLAWGHYAGAMTGIAVGTAAALVASLGREGALQAAAPLLAAYLPADRDGERGLTAHLYYAGYRDELGLPEDPDVLRAVREALAG